MTNLTSSLTVKLIDDVSKPARMVAQALRDAEKAARDVAKGMAGTGATDRFVKSLSGLKATRKDIEQFAAAWRKSAPVHPCPAGLRLQLVRSALVRQLDDLLGQTDGPILAGVLVGIA